MTYNMDNTKAIFTCIDGFSKGSTETDPSWFEKYGERNVTVKQWTDDKSLRKNEYNDCELLSFELSERPKLVDTQITDPKIIEQIAKDTIQSVRASFRKPFVGTGLDDINLTPQAYNITSAYGCYDTLDGTNPDSMYGTDAVPSGIGCKGKWQSITGDYDYQYFEEEQNKVGTKSGLVQTKTEVLL